MVKLIIASINNPNLASPQITRSFPPAEVALKFISHEHGKETRIPSHTRNLRIPSLKFYEVPAKQ